ncbi:hydroxypyruvate isomerase family protein [Clostridium sp. Marseille-P3244]|uniref:hydroxypyruvate isomerase family protein n=1 Tax=Clostridium sp. Marseille-P3244 TaxID=1871020 RepID=UPI000931976E|nr:TIM barrel protein [Clostridium sp. Marseille-P3244]
MKYSVCTDALFPDTPVEDIIPVLRDHGYDTIEFWTWWDKDLERIEHLCAEHQIQISTFCVDFRTNPGIPEDHDKYLEGLDASIRAARRLNCRTLIAQAGWSAEGVPADVHDRALRTVLKDAVPTLEKNDITLILEPLNIKVDHPGYHLSTSEHAFSILDEVGSSHVKLLFDIYHQQITEGNILATIEKHLDQIGHFHIAAVPGRIEPYNGELDYPYIIDQISRLGYNGCWGLEYMPKSDPWSTLDTVKKIFPGNE